MRLRLTLLSLLTRLQAVCFVDLLTLASDRRLQITQESRRLNDKISGLARLPAAGASLSQA